jgi:hypothetical protein
MAHREGGRAGRGHSVRLTDQKKNTIDLQCANAQNYTLNRWIRVRNIEMRGSNGEQCDAINEQ